MYTIYNTLYKTRVTLPGAPPSIQLIHHIIIYFTLIGKVKGYIIVERYPATEQKTPRNKE